MKAIILIVIALSIIMCGCITDNEATDPKIVYATPTPTMEEQSPMKCFGAIIITIAAPGTEVMLWQDCNNGTSVYDSVIVGESGEVKLIAPVPGMYILTTNMGDHILEVREQDVIARNTITVQ